ncbi:MAG: hypothetical protein NC932_03390 [Candidatus Omnitrophica bacterium]|nr:hypothetical protein [Candidatus Omnitrophota bacterium]
MTPKWHIAFCNVTITKYAGMSYADYYGSPVNMLEAQLKASEYAEKRFGVGKFINPYIDSPSGLLSSYLGTPVVYSSEDELPYIDSTRPLLTKPEDIERLHIPDYKTSGLMAKRWEAWQYYISCGYKVRFWTTHGGSVITTACEITSSNIFLWLMENPEKAMKILDFIVSVDKYLEGVDKELCGENPDGYTGDDFAGLLSPEMYKRFAVPYYEKLYEGKKTRSMHSELLRAEHLRIAKEILDITSFHGAEAKNLTTAEMYEIMGYNFWVQVTPQQMKEYTPYQLEEKIKEFANCGAGYVQIYPGRDTPDINMETAITVLQKECKGGPAV